MEQQRQTTTLTPTIEDAPKSNPEAKVVGDKISEQQNGSSYPQTSGVDIAKPIGLDTSGTDFVDATTPSEVKNEKYIDLPKSPKRKVVSRGLILATTVALIIVSLVAGGGILLTKKNTDKLPIKSIEEQSVNSSTAQLLASTIDSGVGEQQLIVNGDSTFNGDLTAVNIDATETLQVGGETVCTIDGCTIDEALLTQTVVEQVTNSVSITTAGNELTIQGTTDQVIVTAAGDVITLSTPQDLATTSNVAFNNLLLGGTLTLPLDCTVNLSDGSLTTNGSGQVICSDDDTGASAIALQDAYENGNTITTIDADGSILFNLANTAGDQDFIVDLLGTGNTVELRDGGNAFFTASDGGRIVLQNTSDVADAFQIQNDTGGSVFNVDNLTGLRPRVVIGEASNLTAELVFQHSSNSNEVTLRSDNQGGLLITPSANASPGVTIAGTRGSLSVGDSTLTSTQIALRVQVGAGATADALQIIDSSATPFLTVGPTGAVLLQNTVDSSAAFQIQNDAGGTVLNVNTVYSAYSNLITTNPDFEGDTPPAAPSDWIARGSATLATTSTAALVHGGNNAMSVVTSAGANDGARIDVDLDTNTTYVFSMWIRTAGSSGNVSDIVLGYRGRGVLGNNADVDCSINHVATAVYGHFICGFTTGNTLADDGEFLYVKRLNSGLADGVTFYVDDVRFHQVVGNSIQIGEVGTTGTDNLSLLEFANDAGGSIFLQPVIGSGRAGEYIITIPAESGVICTTSNASVCATGNDGRFLRKDISDTASVAVANNKFLYTLTNTSSGESGGVLRLVNGDNTNTALKITNTAGEAINVVSNTTGEFAVTIKNDHSSGLGLNIRLDNASGTQSALRVATNGEVYDKFVVQANDRVGINESDPTAALYVTTPQYNDTVAFFGNGSKNGDVLQLSNGVANFAIFDDSRNVTLSHGSTGQLGVTSAGTGASVSIQNTSSGPELEFATTSPIVTINNTGTLSFTDGTNTLLSLADVSSSSTRLTIGVGSGTTTNGSILLHNSSNAFGVTINAPSQTTGSTTISIPDTGADTADTFCLQDAGNCVGVGGSVSGSGTPGVIPVFTGTSAIGDSTLSESGGNLSATGDLTLQGGDLTLGVASTTNGSLILQNATNAFTTTISGANQTAGSATISLPDTVGVADTFCLDTLGNCFGSGSGATLQAAYEAGNTITTAGFDAGRNIEITLADTTTDSDFTINMLGTGNVFQIQDTGTSVFTIADNGALTAEGASFTVATTTGSISLTAGTTPGVNNGAGITLAADDNEGGTGGGISLTAGDGIDDGNAGGDINLTAGDGGTFDVGHDASGGNINITGGIGRGTGTAGQVIITGGTHLGDDGGDVQVKGGAGAISAASGGSVTLAGGDGGATGGCGTANCTVTIHGGNGVASYGAVFINNVTETNQIKIGDGNTASSNTQQIYIGSNNGGAGGAVAGTTSIVMGNIGTSSTVTIQGGNTINIGTGNASSTIQIGNTANAVTQTINIGNNTIASSETNIIIGSAIGASSTFIRSGTGNIQIGVGSNITSTIAIGTGSSSGTKTINIGNGLTSTAVSTITIGSTANTSSLLLQAGSGDITLGGPVSVSTGTDISFVGGASNFDQSASSGTFQTGTGAVTINGSATFGSGDDLTFTGGVSNFDQSASTGTFATGTGAVSLNATTTITGNFVPEAAGTRDLGTTSAEFDQLYLADNGGLVLGLDQDVELGYDEATDDRVELTGTVAGAASLFIEDRLGLGKQAFTTAAGGAGTETLTPTTSFVAVTVTDDGDIIQISEASAKDGDTLIILNVDSTATDTVNIDDVDGQIELSADPVALDQNDSIMLIYSSDRSAWIQISTSNN